jgi:predicted restriction endonuclease
VRCHLSGITQRKLLIASHIVPWSRSQQEQKTDPENGLLLSVLWDALFDKGFISFDEDGKLLCASLLDEDMINCLGISVSVSLDSTLMTKKRKSNLLWHRENVFNNFV